MDWPKCKKCKGKGKISIGGIIVNGEQRAPMDVKEKPCLACNGTGEAAELSEEQAANILKSFHVHTYNPQPGETNYEIKPVDGMIWHWGITFKQALNAAARVIKERGKEGGRK